MKKPEVLIANPVTVGALPTNIPGELSSIKLRKNKKYLVWEES